MQDEYLTRVVIDPSTRSFYLYSSEGDEKVIEVNTVDEFMTVLEFIRTTAPEEMIAFANPLCKNELWFQKSPKKNSGKKLPCRVL